MAGTDDDENGGAIAGTYSVDTKRPLGDVAGGLPAFAVRDPHGDRGDLMAVQVRAYAPARSHLLSAFDDESHPGLCAPVGFGRAAGPDGRYGLFAVGEAPAGVPIAAERPWAEAALIGRVLRPAATALEAIRSRGGTHRNIRFGNVFADAAGAPVRLGQFWAAPGASLQPAVFEPPYVAMCPPAARGEGVIADDVYALGVLLLSLATGRVPMSGLDDEEVVRRKLDLGSFEALVGDMRLAPSIADLIRCMLAEDPDHRPSPELLSDPSAARSRRVAIRPRQRTQRPIVVGDRAVSDVRSLAHALSRDPEQSARLLRSSGVDRWLRRELGDALLAARVEEFGKAAAELVADPGRASALLTMRTIAALDHLAPLVWRGLAFWPDAIGPMLAAMPPHSDEDARVDEVVHGEITVIWGQIRLPESELGLLKQEARQQRAWVRLAGWSGGRPRLRYALNPCLPCASPALEGHHVTRLPELLGALEAGAGSGDGFANLMDREMASFIAARLDRKEDADVALLHKAAGRSPEDPDYQRAALALVRILSALQARHAPDRKLPRLAARIARLTEPLMQSWRNRVRRKQMSEQLADAVSAGSLPAMLAVLNDQPSRALDAREAAAAEHAVREIDRRLALISAAAPERAATAQRMGAEFAAAVSAAALLAVIIAIAVA